MTATHLTGADFRRILPAMAGEIIEAEPRLNALDAAIGDGDHGITMRLGFEAIAECLARLPDGASFDQSLTECAQAFLGATGGAIGVILAKMLLGGAKALRGVRELGTSELEAMLGGMEAGIANAGKARPGDKTILDAVHAAHAAAAVAVQARQALPQALAAAADAAEAGARETERMVCRVGRASRLGERTLGHPDPGAVSFSILMRAFERAASAR